MGYKGNFTPFVFLYVFFIKLKAPKLISTTEIEYRVCTNDGNAMLGKKLEKN